MKFVIARDGSPIEECLFGTLTIDDEFECYTLEHYSVRIPLGLYDTKLYFSPHNSKLVPLLQNVPGRSYIEIHVANFWKELKGCIAVGQSHNDTQLFNSRDAFNALMQKTRLSDTLQVEIR